MNLFHGDEHLRRGSHAEASRLGIVSHTGGDAFGGSITKHTMMDTPVIIAHFYMVRPNVQVSRIHVNIDQDLPLTEQIV